MSKGDENQEKDSQKVESAVKGDIKQSRKDVVWSNKEAFKQQIIQESRKDVGQSNKKVFKADGQNDE